MYGIWRVKLPEQPHTGLTTMLVSHDRASLRSVCDEFWTVDRNTIDWAPKSVLVFTQNQTRAQKNTKFRTQTPTFRTTMRHDPT